MLQNFKNAYQNNNIVSKVVALRVQIDYSLY